MKMKTTQLFLHSVLFFLFLFNASSIAGYKSQQDTLLYGNWLGTLSFGGTELKIIVKIKTDDSGKLTASFDSPDQGALDIPFNTVSFISNKIKAECKMIGGTFEGDLIADSMKITGEWSQGGNSLPLVVKKVYTDIGPNRPQEPKKPYPYKEEEVTIENKTDNIKLAGTLTYPSTAGPFPAVILITGSGPQDRDESLFGHKPFLVISDHLTRNGIAVLRMDDRGIGKSTGNFGTATTFDFVKDILAAVEYLKTRNDINIKQIGLAGHSEGGMIAPLAAVKSTDVAFIVLLAGPGVPGDELISRQIEAIYSSSGLSEEMTKKVVLFAQSIFGVFKQDLDSTAQGQRISAIMKEYIDGLTEDEKKSPFNSAEALKRQVQTFSSPWFKAFLRYDPRPTLEKVKCPVLALNGAKDMQVDLTQNLLPIKEALKKGGNTKFEAIELPGLNHLFQHTTSGGVSDYGKIEETISPEALKIITDWILKTINSGK